MLKLFSNEVTNCKYSEFKAAIIRGPRALDKPVSQADFYCAGNHSNTGPVYPFSRGSRVNRFITTRDG